MSQILYEDSLKKVILNDIGTLIVQNLRAPKETVWIDVNDDGSLVVSVPPKTCKMEFLGEEVGKTIVVRKA